MAQTVDWKPKALVQYREIVHYLIEEFSLAVAEQFVLDVTQKTALLARYPESGQPTRFKTVRRKKIGRHNYFYYRISGQKIIILFVWDGRMDPGKNPYNK